MTNIEILRAESSRLYKEMDDADKVAKELLTRWCAANDALKAAEREAAIEARVQAEIERRIKEAQVQANILDPYKTEQPQKPQSFTSQEGKL